MPATWDKACCAIRLIWYSFLRSSQQRRCTVRIVFMIVPLLAVSVAHGSYADIVQACTQSQVEQVFMYTDHAGRHGSNVSIASSRMHTGVNMKDTRRACRRGAAVVAHCHLEDELSMLFPSTVMPGYLGSDIKAAYSIEQFCAEARYPDLAYPPLRHIIVVPQLNVLVEFFLPQEAVVEARSNTRIQTRLRYGTHGHAHFLPLTERRVLHWDAIFHEAMYEQGGTTAIVDTFQAGQWEVPIPIGPFWIILRELQQ